MSFKDQQLADLDVFYNTDEFADSATYKGTQIPLVEIDDMSIESIEGTNFSCKSSDVPLPIAGEAFVINNKNYELLNFDSDFTEFETLLVLVEK